MSPPTPARIDFQVTASDSGITLIAAQAASDEPGLLDPESERDWEAVQTSGVGVHVFTESKGSARVIVGALDWGDVDGLVDRATWKLELPDGGIVLGGVGEGDTELSIEPGIYWATIYSFAREGAAGNDAMVHLHKAEKDEDFLKTSMAWIPSTDTEEEPLAMGSEETSEIAFEDEVTEELMVGAFGDEDDEEELDEDSSADSVSINVRLRDGKDPS